MKPEKFHVWTVWHPRPAKVPASKTFKAHYDILQQYKEVFWGVITRRAYQSRHPFEHGIKCINEQLKNDIETFLFIKPRDDQDDPIRGLIKEVKTSLSGWEKLETVPQYYREILKKDSKYGIQYWFLLSAIEIIDPKTLLRLTKFEEFDPTHGALGYPYPCLCKFTTIKKRSDGVVLSWKDIIIILIDAETVEIQIKGEPDKKKRYTFDDLDFDDKRNKSENLPIKAWKVLAVAASSQGYIDFKSNGKSLCSKFPNFKKLIDITEDRLRRGLRLAIGSDYVIEGKAFKHQKKTCSYNAQFTVMLSPYISRNREVDKGQDISDEIRKDVDEYQEMVSVKSRYES